MFYKEGRIDRELYWSGFGFQVWLQMLTHLLSNEQAKTIVIDEPDIYLHPDLQLKLLSILRATDAQVIVATHSVEIINEAERDEVILIEPRRAKSRRIAVRKHPMADQTEQLERYVRKVIREEAGGFKDVVFGQLCAHAIRFTRRTKKDESTVVQEVSAWMNPLWKSVEGRLALVPGKETLAAINRRLESAFGISLTYALIVSHMSKAEIPSDLVELLTSLQKFVTTQNG